MRWQDKTMIALGIGGLCFATHFYGAYQSERAKHVSESTRIEETAPVHEHPEYKQPQITVEPKPSSASELAEKIDFAFEFRAPLTRQPINVGMAMDRVKYINNCMKEEQGVIKMVAGSRIWGAAAIKNNSTETLDDLNVKLDLSIGFSPIPKEEPTEQDAPSRIDDNTYSTYLRCYQNAITNGVKFRAYGSTKIEAYGGEGEAPCGTIGKFYDRCYFVRDTSSFIDPTLYLPEISIPRIPYQRYTFSAILRLGDDEIKRQSFDIYTVKSLE